MSNNIDKLAGLLYSLIRLAVIIGIGLFVLYAVSGRR